MDESQINEIADRLDSLAGSDPADIRTVGGKPASCLFVFGNQTGFLRLAACCLRAAVSSLTDDSRPVTLGDSVHQQFDPAEKQSFVFGFFKRVESFPDFDKTLEERRRKAEITDRWFLFGCALVAFLFLMPFFIGVGVLIATFFRGQ